MKMKSILICFLMFYSVIIRNVLAEETLGLNSLKLIPKDTMTIIILRNKPNDVGLNFVKEKLKYKFSIERSEERQEVIEDLTKMFSAGEIIGASFYTSSQKPLFVLCISTNNDDTKLIDFFSQKINVLFGNPDAIWNEEHAGYQIIYNPERFQKPDNKDLSCYTILDNKILISNDFGLLKKIINNFINKGASILDSKDFSQASYFKDSGSDGLIYISNLNNELTNSIESWREEIGFVPLTSADLIKSIWFSFDLIDRNTARGQMVFIPFNKESGQAIIGDASFLMEAMRRKFIAEGLNYNKNVSVSEDGIARLNFELQGISALWDRLFSEGSGESLYVDLGPAIVIEGSY